MSDSAGANPIERIEVRIRVGDDRMAATDDPVFVVLCGGGGREFRLAPARGNAFRRGTESHFVLASGSDANVAHPELNDPTRPAISAAAVTTCLLRKRSEPIPNVRGLGEMDDRVEIAHVEIEIHARGLAQPRRFVREGPLWLGLVCGVETEVPPESPAA